MKHGAYIFDLSQAVTASSKATKSVQNPCLELRVSCPVKAIAVARFWTLDMQKRLKYSAKLHVRPILGEHE